MQDRRKELEPKTKPIPTPNQLRRMRLELGTDARGVRARPGACGKVLCPHRQPMGAGTSAAQLGIALHPAQPDQEGAAAEGFGKVL